MDKQLATPATFNDLAGGLAEYKALTTFMDRIMCNPPPPVPCSCRVCGISTAPMIVSWSEIDHEIKLGHGDHPYHITAICDPCADYEMCGGDDDE